MRSVHYFPRYSQRENVITNNVLLLLVRLHEFSRLKFETLMQELCEDAEVDFAPQWLHFRQQVASKSSVVDGFIAQDSVKIAVETKRKGNFSSEQLKNHLTLFKGEQHKLLILLSPSIDNSARSQLAEIQTIAEQSGVHLISTSFRTLIDKFGGLFSPHDEEMLALIADFESFCTDEELLPNGDLTIFVPPCGKSLQDNLELQLYYCPADWNRRPAKYLGIYKDRKVQAIGRISKVVQCEIDEKRKQVTAVGGQHSLTVEEQVRVVEAASRAPKQGWSIASGHRFYLCDDWAETNFAKTTSGGIMGHRYFNLRDHIPGSIPQTVKEIATLLDGSNWQ